MFCICLHTGRSVAALGHLRCLAIVPRFCQCSGCHIRHVTCYNLDASWLLLCEGLVKHIHILQIHLRFGYSYPRCPDPWGVLRNRNNNVKQYRSSSPRSRMTKTSTPLPHTCWCLAFHQPQTLDASAMFWQQVSHYAQHTQLEERQRDSP